MILASRRGHVSDALRLSDAWQRIADSATSVIKIFHVRCDVADEADVQRLVSASLSGELPRIVGVLHAAGVLADDMLDKQTKESIIKVWDAKAKGHGISIGRSRHSNKKRLSKSSRCFHR